MKTVKFELNGQPFFLCFNGAAFFALQEKFGEGFNIGTLLAETNGKYGTLSEQGELTRRYLGYAPADIPAPEFFAVTLSPLDALRAKKAVLDALRLGFARDVKDTQGIDLYELEYQKKNGLGLNASQYIGTLTQALGLSVREGLLLTLGQVNDLLCIRLKSLPPRR